MKNLLLITILFVALMSCAPDSKIAGTADDVSNGSILGKVLVDGAKTSDTVLVCLYSAELAKKLAKMQEPIGTLIKTVLSYDGTYAFDSLAAGTYQIEVLKDSIMVGEQKNIKLDKNEQKEVNITIVIIINQTFNIWTDESQHITINNIYMTNGNAVKTDSGYVLSYADTDTLIMEVEIEKDGVVSIAKVRVIRQDDGTSRYEVIEGATADEIVITAGAEPVPGYLGDITITLKNPGTIDVESSFDTGSVPTKSDQKSSK